MPAEMRTLPFLNLFVGLVVMIAALYWAKAVVIPVALALLLTFLLTPIVNALWRCGLGRAPAAVAVVVLVFGLVGALGGPSRRKSPPSPPSSRPTRTTSSRRSPRCGMPVQGACSGKSRTRSRTSPAHCSRARRPCRARRRRSPCGPRGRRSSGSCRRCWSRC